MLPRFTEGHLSPPRLCRSLTDTSVTALVRNELISLNINYNEYVVHFCAIFLIMSCSSHMMSGKTVVVGRSERSIGTGAERDNGTI